VVALAVPAASPARGEIRHEMRGGEIVATNIPSAHPRPEVSASVGIGRARPLGSSAVPVTPPPIVDLLEGSAVRYGFDPAFIEALVAAESSFDHRAVSPKGARGLMQLMPATARRFGIRDVHDPASNLEAGVAFLRELVQRFHGDMALALAAYNAGPEAVARYGGVPPYEETREYLKRIRVYYGDDLQKGDRSTGGVGIRLAKVESGGVPHYTNLRPRRPARGAPAAVRTDAP